MPKVTGSFRFRHQIQQQFDTLLIWNTLEVLKNFYLGYIWEIFQREILLRRSNTRWEQMYKDCRLRRSAVWNRPGKRIIKTGFAGIWVVNDIFMSGRMGSTVRSEWMTSYVFWWLLALIGSVDGFEAAQAYRCTRISCWRGCAGILESGSQYIRRIPVSSCWVHETANVLEKLPKGHATQSQGGTAQISGRQKHENKLIKHLTLHWTFQPEIYKNNGISDKG